MRLVAYTMFRFDREDGEDVVYWYVNSGAVLCIRVYLLFFFSYELQVSKDAQQRGIGRMLMQLLSHIGGKWGMRKVMLTALKRNTAALRFYQSAG